MKTLVTVTCNGPEEVRISRVTAHGEEVIEADVHAKLLAMMLWRQLGQGDPPAGQPLFPSLHSLERLISRLSVDLQALATALDKHTLKIGNLRIAPAEPPVVPARARGAQ